MNAVDQVLGWLAGWIVTEPVQYGAVFLLIVGAFVLGAGLYTVWAHYRAETGDRR